MVLAATVFLSSQAEATHDFELIMDRYAGVDTVYAVAINLNGIAINTGTEGDTLDISITYPPLPLDWGIDLCIRGACIGHHGEAYLDPGDTVDFYVYVTPWSAQPEMATGVLTLSYRNAPSVTQSEPFAAFTDLPSILIVDDDDGAGYETYLESAVDDAGYKAHVYDADTYGRPGPVRLSSYWAVLWTTADGSASYITSGDEEDMMTFLDRGGNLFLTSAGFLPSRGAPTTFTTDYLHVPSWTDSAGGTLMTGVPGDPISDGMSLNLSGGPLSTPEQPDFDGDGVGDVCFISGGTDSMGIRVEEGGHKIAFVTFPFENVPVADPDPDNQKTLIGRIISWFDPPTAGIDGKPAGGDVLILGQNSPNPFAGYTRISFAVPRGGKHGELVIYNVKGQVVRTFMTGRAAETENSVVWDGTDDDGTRMASGVYFYRLSVDGSSVLRKMVLLK
jgi:hypothetical protein